ncbi:5-methylaminomethyl-2-thiouridylate-methyltransferase [Macrolepiota fuliginosa MF-IS2]|uniref:tRNA-5-taurinomethyluridine 2-sulfurtransferase n=1 Tax=Macrolepiota fuliginosa MF-IS2 TaxID=1400762 RepID=A0A9P6C3F7_9AGAR|nr:5-methylaminomethyl-2-thiouridylate-methyltransferase [Macrolepiota fuliginosa MF-IS2]
MRNWDTRDESGTDRGCEWEKDWEDVQQVCRKLDIPCQMIDLSREYWNNVFEPSLQLWESGVTPNPDVWCNKEIKFGALLERLPLASSGNIWFATGHYTRKTWSNHSDGTPRPQLLRGLDPNKDQSYYLSSISEAGLRRALFPLGGLSKSKVRELAKDYQLPTAERPESMGICFVGEKSRFNRFVSSYIPPNPGPIVDKTTGRTIAEHHGLWNYTIGENARIAGMPMKMFVSQKDTSTNTIFVVPGTDNDLLYCQTLHVPHFSWIWKDSPPREIDTEAGLQARVMHRYRMVDVPCTIHRVQNSGELKIDFDRPEKSVSPGQVAALYDEAWCLGCGIIERTS